MTADQNEPVGGPEPSQQMNLLQGPSATPANGQRRRRRRRKANKVFAAPAANGQSGQEISSGDLEPQSAAQIVAAAPVAAVHAPKTHTPKKNRPQNGFQPGANSGQNGGNQPRSVQKSQFAGNGGTQQQGPRRKGKQRRQAPVFVGPMDHSYRTVNGNIADGPPSSMDYRSHHRGGSIDRDFPNGNVAARGQYADPYDAPAAVRPDAPTRILCFIEDLFVVAKLQETAKKLGVKVGFLKADKDIVTRLTDVPETERPSLIVFDLNNASAKPLALIPKLKAKLKRGTSVIGFLSHIQGDLKVKAIEAGCDMVMPKSAFSQNLPNLLRRHGLEEELEPAEA